MYMKLDLLATQPMDKTGKKEMKNLQDKKKLLKDVICTSFQRSVRFKLYIHE